MIKNLLKLSLFVYCVMHSGHMFGLEWRQPIYKIKKYAECRSLHIRVRENDGDSFGQGFFISSSGLILTAKHVIEDSIGSRCDITWINDQSELCKAKAEILAKHPELDVAVLKICNPGHDTLCYFLTSLISTPPPDNNTFRYFSFDEASFEGGEWVFMSYRDISPPSHSIRGGQVTGLEDAALLSTICSYNGDSGAPCLLINGKCIGVNIATQDYLDRLNVIVPYHAFKEWLEDRFPEIYEM